MFKKLMLLAALPLSALLYYGCFGPCIGGVCACTEGQTCDIPCDDGSCVVNCDSGSSCDVACAGGSCTVNCDGTETCDVACKEGSCTVNGETSKSVNVACEGGSCTVNCGSDTESCKITECTESCTLECSGANTCETSCEDLDKGCVTNS